MSISEVEADILVCEDYLKTTAPGEDPTEASRQQGRDAGMRPAGGLALSQERRAAIMERLMASRPRRSEGETDAARAERHERVQQLLSERRARGLPGRSDAGPGSLVSPESSFGTLYETRSLLEVPTAAPRGPDVQQDRSRAVPPVPRMTIHGQKVPTLPPLAPNAASQSKVQRVEPQSLQFPQRTAEEAIASTFVPLVHDSSMLGGSMAHSVLPLLLPHLYRPASGSQPVQQAAEEACEAYSTACDEELSRGMEKERSGDFGGGG
eukprot:jgi/Botrbrau1/938/Bobra.0167s0049.1